MAIVKIGQFNYPDWKWQRPLFGSTGKTSIPISTASDAIELRLTATASGTIDHVYWGVGTLTTSGTLRVSFQNVGDDSGYGPQAHGDGTDTHWADVTVSSSNMHLKAGPITDDGTASGVKKVVNPGDNISLQIRRAPGSSFDGNLFILNATDSPGELHDQVPILTPNFFKSTDGGSTWSFQAGAGDGAIGFDDGSYMQTPGMLAIDTWDQLGPYASNTSPDEIGMKVIPEMTIEVTGVWCLGGDKRAEIRIYDASDTVLVSKKTGLHGGVNGTGNYRYHYFTPITLQASNTYRITYTYLSSDNEERIYAYTVPATEVMAQRPFGGLNFHATERTNGGAWTDTTNRQLTLGVVVSGIDINPVADRGPAMHRLGAPMNASVAKIF